MDIRSRTLDFSKFLSTASINSLPVSYVVIPRTMYPPGFFSGLPLADHVLSLTKISVMATIISFSVGSSPSLRVVLGNKDSIILSLSDFSASFSLDSPQTKLGEIKPSSEDEGEELLSLVSAASTLAQSRPKSAPNFLGLFLKSILINSNASSVSLSPLRNCGTHLTSSNFLSIICCVISGISTIRPSFHSSSNISNAIAISFFLISSNRGTNLTASAVIHCHSKCIHNEFFHECRCSIKFLNPVFQ
mmetsp:Transcript_18182/g.27273  ORF Transcript_18182/g.27273 Transcript_18182/m.27273 type:complete len:247 (-) Transcript_18182:581-1321(-)